MISVQEAKQIIKEGSVFFRIKKMPLSQAFGKVLAVDVVSPIDTPPFNQSAMDGYAFSFDTWDKTSALTVVEEVQAGSFYNHSILPNQAIRIFTGACVPNDVDTVVAQEKVLISNDTITIQEPDIFKGRNVRPKGSQTERGSLVLQKGHVLHPPSISLLANLGIHAVEVFDVPTISLIITGKELVTPGDEIGEGQIYESNSYALSAVLSQMQIAVQNTVFVDDTLSETEQAIQSQLSSDIIILTGGVSVGDYDFVAQALQNCGTETLFHKIKQKPGKPFYFGCNKQTLVFALPGNPAAVLTCFYAYVAEAISCFTGKTYFKTKQVELQNTYSKKSGLTHFVKGIYDNNKVTILEGQESYLVNSFAKANCLVVISEDSVTMQTGDSVEIICI